VGYAGDNQRAKDAEWHEVIRQIFQRIMEVDHGLLTRRIRTKADTELR